MVHEHIVNETHTGRKRQRFPGSGFPTGYNTAPVTAWISSHQVRVFGISSVPGFQPPVGLPPLGNDAHLTSTLHQLDGTLGKLASETELARTSKERATSDKDRAITKFGHLPSRTKTMIIRASEDPPKDATDANGDILTWRLLSASGNLRRYSQVGDCGVLQVVP
eukprot:scaffold38834_cov33-Attheya_sp.AAC.3